MNIIPYGKPSRKSQWLILLFGLTLVLGIAACSSDDNGTQVPDIIALPTGFRPEGIAISGTSLFVGSIPSGRVFKADITTGQGEIIVNPVTPPVLGFPSPSAIGMKVDSRGRLFVAGGATGQAHVYDAGTGAGIEAYSLATGTTFINDVILAPDAAWYTDSFNPTLYKVPIGIDGSLGAVTPLPLTGAFATSFVSGPGVFNANGIAAKPDGSMLILVQSNTGKLFTVDPGTGATQEINLGAENVANGDGILLQGQTLYVVQNQTNQLAVITLSSDFTTGTVTQRVTNPSFDVPTTVAASNGSLYLVNARFGSVENPDTAEYSVVRINKPSPDVIPLPTGFRPEGIAISGTSLFVGSIPSGRVFKADIATGQGSVFVDPPTGRSAIGLKVDGRGRLFVAGGATGQAYVYDAGTGADIAVYSLATGTTFINDVTLAPDAAWFTDSRNPVLYKVPIGTDGTLGAQAAITPLTLTGDFVFVEGVNNANGIAATPDGATLIIVQSSTGKLFTVNPATGATREINLGAEIMTNGDGILLQGQTLYVVQNRLNQVAMIALSADLASGTVTGRTTSPAFDVPTTVAASGGSLYLPNARFGIANADTADYAVVRINKP